MGRKYWVAGGACGSASMRNMRFYVQMTHFPNISIPQLELLDPPRREHLAGMNRLLDVQTGHSQEPVGLDQLEHVSRRLRIRLIEPLAFEL